MADISRKKQKIFGDSGGVSEFGQFGSNQASPPGTTTKDLDQIQALANFDQGWYAATANAGEPPRIQDMNSLFLLLTTQMKYLYQKGIPEWLDDADERYYANKSFVSKNGKVFIAILGDDVTNINVQKDPETEASWWLEILSPSGSWPIGSTYIQFPGDDSPSTLGLPGTWANVSSELAGDFIRFEGGDASAFEAGQQSDQFQGFGMKAFSSTGSGGTTGCLVYEPDGGAPSPSFRTGVIEQFVADGYGTPRVGDETRSINRTVRKWRRTA